jgi:hypothetical protein
MRRRVDLVMLIDFRSSPRCGATELQTPRMRSSAESIGCAASIVQIWKTLANPFASFALNVSQRFAPGIAAGAALSSESDWSHHAQVPTGGLR